MLDKVHDGVVFRINAEGIHNGVAHLTYNRLSGEELAAGAMEGYSRPAVGLRAR